MKYLNLIFVWAAAQFLLFSCSSSDNDFVGKYNTFYCSYVELANESNPFLLRNGKQGVTAKKFYNLNPVELEIFIDEADKKLKGEGVIRYTRAENFSLKPSLIREKMNVELSNFRIQNDTLWFSLTNDLLKMGGRNYKGYIVKNGEQSFVGLEKEFSGTNRYSEKSPFFKASSKVMYTYLASDKEEVSLLKSFYELQKTDLEQLLQEDNSKFDEAVIKNSILHLEGKLKQIKAE
jgi:hypothetical protein